MIVLLSVFLRDSFPLATYILRQQTNSNRSCAFWRQTSIILKRVQRLILQTLPMTRTLCYTWLELLEALPKEDTGVSIQHLNVIFWIPRSFVFIGQCPSPFLSM